MMTNPVLLIACGLYCIAPSASARAKAAPSGLTLSRLEPFNLPVLAEPAADARAAQRRAAAPTEFAEDAFSGADSFGPSWHYQHGVDGPVFAFESLGSGKKGRPKLAHVALDWQF